jgi:hypothetical protein
MNAEPKPFDVARQLLASTPTAVPSFKRAEPQERSFEKLRPAARRLGWSVPQLYRMAGDGVITIYANGSRGRVVLKSDVDRLIDAMVAAGPAQPDPSIRKALAARMRQRGNTETAA